ncbi:MAG: hypothetical protein KME46_34185 [Brasilonema angustatum HA4187-MV1]|nr:hypothetical protein [Brasilonema angustatum HA4187-MV1]
MSADVCDSATARTTDTDVKRSPFFPQRGFSKTPLPKSPIWGNQTPFGWGIGRAKCDGAKPPQSCDRNFWYSGCDHWVLIHKV